MTGTTPPTSETLRRLATQIGKEIELTGAAHHDTQLEAIDVIGDTAEWAIRRCGILEARIQAALAIIRAGTNEADDAAIIAAVQEVLDPGVHTS